MPYKKQKKKKKAKEQEGYLISKNAKAQTAQSIFDKLCRDIANGRYREPIVNTKSEAIPPELITKDNFQMCYKSLNDTDLMHNCRKMLPKYWFISKDGKIISLSRSKPVWYMGTKEGRTPEERQVRFREQNGCKFKRDITAKERELTTYNYAIVAVVYDSILIADEELKENIRKYGFEAFGVGNSGNSDEETKDKIAGQRGLTIKGKEIIKPDNMMDVHHIEGAEIISPDCLEIMPHWLHEECKAITASVETAKEFKNLLERNVRSFTWLTKTYPQGYMILDNSKTFDKDGKTNIYIYYKGVNQTRPEQVDSNKHKYFAIIPYEYYGLGLKLQIIGIMQELCSKVKEAGKEPLYYDLRDCNGNLIKHISILTATEEVLKDFTFYITYYDIFDKIRAFTMKFIDGNIEHYRTIIYNTFKNQDMVNKFGIALESFFDKNGKLFIYDFSKYSNPQGYDLKIEFTDGTEDTDND